MLERPSSSLDRAMREKMWFVHHRGTGRSVGWAGVVYRCSVYAVKCEECYLLFNSFVFFFFFFLMWRIWDFGALQQFV